VLRDPAIIAALLPTHAFLFILDRPFLAFVAMGAVVLSITGAEALYADMGHFGARAIRAAWFFLALPCLTLNYLGQGSLVLDNPSASSAPFFLLAPDWARLPLVVLTTMATVIASQAVISGAFSVSREAQRLGFLPRLTVRQTSEHEGGQIYVPSINWLLCGGVLLLIALFRTSERLATAYGLAVTGHPPAHYHPLPRARPHVVALGAGPDRRDGPGLRSPRAGLLRGEPDQGRARWVVASPHRLQRHLRDADLAARR